MDAIKEYSCRITRLRWGQWYTHDDPAWPPRMRLMMQLGNGQELLAWLFGDVLLGRERFTRSAAVVHDVVLQLPEGDYPLRVSLCVITGRRPRWPWTTSRDDHAEIEVLKEGGIPGAWPGRTSLPSLVCSASTVEEALVEVRWSVAFARQDIPELKRLNESGGG